jgi:hypothetical protein
MRQRHSDRGPPPRTEPTCIFLGRSLRTARVQKVVRASTTRIAHLLRVAHRDEVEPPITDSGFGNARRRSPSRPSRHFAAGRRLKKDCTP